MAADRFFAIYLNDHLAGATLGLELAKRAAREHPGELGLFLAGLAVEIAEDRLTLLELMETLGAKPQQYKVALAWAAEKAGRLKPNGRILQRSPLTPLVELEGLAVGIHGKLLLWRTLRGISRGEELAARLDALIARAARQLEQLEPHRLAAAATVG